MKILSFIFAEYSRCVGCLKQPDLDPAMQQMNLSAVSLEFLKRLK
jgi:hypothetical protein